MKEVSFLEWLIREKQLSPRSSQDVTSRLKRVAKILSINTSSISNETTMELGHSLVFSELSMTVKSQLRRAVKLYLEYSNKKGVNQDHC